MKYSSSSLLSMQSERGATMLEYCFILLLIMIGCVAGITSLGDATSEKLTDPQLQAAFQ